MLAYNTMRFGTDEFLPFVRKALLVATTPINLTKLNRIDQFTIQGIQPEGSDRRFMFKADNKIYKFSGQELVEYTGTVTVDNVLKNGNTAAQVEAVKNNKTLASKNIYPIIALYSETQDIPSAKIVVTASNVQEVLDSVEAHNDIVFKDLDTDEKVPCKILDFAWDVETQGDAEAGFKVKLFQNDAWTDWLKLSEAAGQVATKLIPRYYYHVDAVDGYNSVKIKYFYVYFSQDADYQVFGDTAHLFSYVKNFGINIKGCVLIVRHEPLDYGTIRAYASLQKKRGYVTNEVLGYVSAGVYRTAFKFIPSSLNVYVNGLPATEFTVYEDNQSFYVAESKWGATPPYSVSVDYTYDTDGGEHWAEMTADKAQPTENDLYSTRFFIKIDDADKALGAIRLDISRGTGTETLNIAAAGENQTVKLAHEPDSIYSGNAVWDYDDETRILTFTADEGETTANFEYTWHGQTPCLDGWSAAFIT